MKSVYSLLARESFKLWLKFQMCFYWSQSLKIELSHGLMLSSSDVGIWGFTFSNIPHQKVLVPPLLVLVIRPNPWPEVFARNRYTGYLTWIYYFRPDIKISIQPLHRWVPSVGAGTRIPDPFRPRLGRNIGVGSLKKKYFEKSKFIGSI